MGASRIGRALDEVDERAHRERDAALGEIAADAVERREQPELLVDEPREPVAGDLGALVGRGQRARAWCAARHVRQRHVVRFTTRRRWCSLTTCSFSSTSSSTTSSCGAAALRALRGAELRAPRRARCVGSGLRPVGLDARGCFGGFSGSGGRRAAARRTRPCGASTRGVPWRRLARRRRRLRCLRCATASSSATRSLSFAICSMRLATSLIAQLRAFSRRSASSSSELDEITASPITSRSAVDLYGPGAVGTSPRATR